MTVVCGSDFMFLIRCIYLKKTINMYTFSLVEPFLLLCLGGLAQENKFSPNFCENSDAKKLRIHWREQVRRGRAAHTVLASGQGLKQGIQKVLNGRLELENTHQTHEVKCDLTALCKWVFHFLSLFNLWTEKLHITSKDLM